MLCCYNFYFDFLGIFKNKNLLKWKVNLIWMFLIWYWMFLFLLGIFFYSNKYFVIGKENIVDLLVF